MSRRSLVFTIVAVWLSQSAFADGTGLEKKLPLVDRLPAETTHYVFRAGSDVLSKKLKGTPVGEMMKDEDVSEFFKSMEGMLDNCKDDYIKSTWQIVKSAIYCDIVCAHIPGEAGEREILMVAIPATADRRKKLKAVYDKHITLLFDKMEEEPANHAEKVKGGELYGKAAENEAQVGWIDDQLVLFGGPKARSVILGEKPARPLTSQANLKKVVAALQLNNPIGFYFYNLEPLWKGSIGDEKPDAGSWARRIYDSGLTSLLAMGGASNVVNKRYANEHFWVVDGRKGGLFKHVAANPIPPSWLKSIPENAVSFTYGTIDPPAFMSLFLSGTNHADGEEEGAGEDAQLTDPVGNLLGFKIERALVHGLGTRYMVCRIPNDGDLINPMIATFPPFVVLPPHQVVVAFEITDEKGFQAAFKRLWSKVTEHFQSNAERRGGFFGAPPGMRTFEYRGETIYELTYMLGFYFHLDKDKLMFSLNPQLIKDMIRHKATMGKSLTDLPEFKAAYGKVPPEACFIVYMHKRKLFDTLYRGYKSMGQQLGPMLMTLSTSSLPGLSFSFADMPRASAFSSHMRESGYLYAVAHKDGVLFKGEADVLSVSWWIANVHAFADIMMSDFPDL